VWARSDRGYAGASLARSQMIVRNLDIGASASGPDGGTICQQPLVNVVSAVRICPPAPPPLPVHWHPTPAQRAGPANATEWYQGTVVLDHLVLASTSADAIRVSGQGSVDIHDVHVGSTGQQAFAGAAASQSAGARALVRTLLTLAPLRCPTRAHWQAATPWSTAPPSPCWAAWQTSPSTRASQPPPCRCRPGSRGAPRLERARIQPSGSPRVALRCRRGHARPGGIGRCTCAGGRVPGLRSRPVRRARRRRGRRRTHGSPSGPRRRRCCVAPPRRPALRRPLCAPLPASRLRRGLQLLSR